MRFKHYLIEKTFAIGKDVDFIYNNAFKKPLKMIKANKNMDTFKDGDEQLFNVIKSSSLPSKKSQKASKINPVNIKCGVFPKGSYYIPNIHTISLSLHPDAIKIISNSKKSLKKFDMPSWNKELLQRFKNEFSETAIKATIYHELSHWLNDTFHNSNLKKRIDIANQTQDKTILTKNGSDLYTDFEIDAQVHALKQMKRNLKKEWNDLTWWDIIQHKSAFHVIFSSLKREPKKVQMEYMKTMLSRLNREKLLGDKMKTTFFDAIKKI